SCIRWPFVCVSSRCSSDGPERPDANGEAPGSNPGTGARLVSPTCSANGSWGLVSGLRPRQGLYTHCYCVAGVKKGQGLNDLPQLQNRTVKAGTYGRKRIQRYKC